MTDRRRQRQCRGAREEPRYALATVLYAVIDMDHEQMRICLAGHFPPVIALPGLPAELVRTAAGLMIGVGGGAKRTVTTMAIPPGALLCFYTDGLIERPGELVDDGLNRLCQIVTAQPAEAACADVMGALIGSEPARDDVALLIIHRQVGADPPGDLTR